MKEDIQNLLFEEIKSSNLKGVSKASQIEVFEPKNIEFGDWTSNILTAAFFACSSDFDKNGKLYAYFPTQYAYLEKDVLVPGGEPERVVGYQPKSVAERLQAQSGYFTYHKEEEFKVLNERFRPGGHDTLFEWTIPSECKASIINMLDRLSVNYKTLFPDLDGLSKHHCLMDQIRLIKER